jgi:peptidoglycan/LPS O-acetylase OafA/YrhL
MEDTTMKPPVQHIRYLGGLRGSAALFVVLHHAWLQTWPKVIDPKAVPHGYVAVFTGWLAFGHLAVTVFIAISEFCLMLPVLRGSGEPRDGAVDLFARRAGSNISTLLHRPIFFRCHRDMFLESPYEHLI